MKKIISKLMGGVFLFSLSMSLTSCEGALDDILGEWSRPTPGGTATVTSISIDPTLALKVGETGQLTATVDPAGTAVTWSSDQEEVATVDANGLVTAVAVGTAIITAKAGDKKATCTVTVTPGLATPLTVEAITAGTIKVDSPKSNMQFSKNGGAKETMTSTTEIPVEIGDKVAFYGNDTNIKSYNGTKIVGGTADIKVYGNIMSLVDETGFATNTTLTVGNTFSNLFVNNDNLKDASGLLLPAETLTNFCYSNMFYGCKALTTAPAELPAETLANSCYWSMFYGCKALTAASALPAETLADGCYKEMFDGCTSLTTAPALPATMLASQCYMEMFNGCTSLKTAYVKAAYITANNECTYMFDGCNAAGAVLHTTTANKGDWSSSGVPGNWTVADDWN